MDELQAKPNGLRGMYASAHNARFDETKDPGAAAPGCRTCREIDAPMCGSARSRQHFRRIVPKDRLGTDRPSILLKKGYLHEYPPGSCSTDLADRGNSDPHHSPPAELYRRALYDYHRADRAFRCRHFSPLTRKWPPQGRNLRPDCGAIAT